MVLTYVGKVDNHMWARNYSECTVCGTTEKHHKGGGLCRTCYFRQYKRGDVSALAKALPGMFKRIGITGVFASFKDGQVTIRKGNLTATWPE